MSQPGVTRVLVVDDHRTLAELLSDAVDREPDLAAVGIAGTVEQAVVRAAELRPDLIVMDVQLPDGTGFDATRRILEDAPDTRVIMLTAHTDTDFVVRAAESGACAFLPKDGSLARMLSTIRSARAGTFEFRPPTTTEDPMGPPAGFASTPPQSPLSPRELEVLRLMGEGHDVRTIATTLGITEQTCRGYVKSLLVKLDAHSQLQAVVAAWRLGLLRHSSRN